MMEYQLNAVQQMVRSTVRELFEREAGPKLTRAVESDGFDPAIWRRLADLGLLGLALPEQDGGSGGMLDLVVVAEEIGRAIVPVPFVSTLTAAWLIASLGSDRQRHEHLPAIIAGDRRLALAISEAEATFEPDAITCQAEGGRLTGEKRYVVDAAAADALLVVARSGAGPADLGLYLVEFDDGRPTTDDRRPRIADGRQSEVGGRSFIVEILEPTVAGDRLGRYQFDGASAEAVGAPGAVWPVIANAIDRARIAQAAQTVGMAASALERAVDYAKTRVQFGRPIGTFQALQHRIADLATELEAARFLAYEAAWRVDEGLPASGAAAGALAAAAGLGQRLAPEAAHIFGGYGVAVENDIQLYYRRLRAAETRWGDPSALLNRVAAAWLGE